MVPRLASAIGQRALKRSREKAREFSNAVIWRLGSVSMKQFLRQSLDRPSKDEQKRGQDGGNSQQAPVTQSTDDAEYGANPDRRGRRQPGHVTHRVAQNNSGPDEADTGQDSLDNAADSIRVCRGKRRSDSSSHTDQSMRAQAGGLSVELAIQSENGTNDERRAEAQHDLFIFTQHSTMLC
jgi:hypothetical protein